jgi:hypothetical protein
LAGYPIPKAAAVVPTVAILFDTLPPKKTSTAPMLIRAALFSSTARETQKDAGDNAS